MVKEWKLFYLYKELNQTFEILYDDASSTTDIIEVKANELSSSAGLLRDDIMNDLKEFENIYER